MLKETISGFIDKVCSIDGVSACALVSRDGIIIGKYFDRELNEPWFGALSATIQASAESVGDIIKSRSVLSVTIRAQDFSLIIVGEPGKIFLLQLYCTIMRIQQPYKRRYLLWRKRSGRLGDVYDISC